MRIRKGEQEMSSLEESRVFKLFDRKRVGVRKENGPSYLEASLLRGSACRPSTAVGYLIAYKTNCSKT